MRDVVGISPGPRLDWFDPVSFERLLGGVWTVTESSRVGVRLSGVRLFRRIVHDLPSEGLVRGAIQVPPDSDPVMMLADHPTTGGYPVIAVVHPDDVATVAQTPPGHAVRFDAHAGAK
jgi:allophanate hydrolase subunit 2